MSNYEAEIKRRRTFAIISHPDAGKTTLTEKFAPAPPSCRKRRAGSSRPTERLCQQFWILL